MIREIAKLAGVSKSTVSLVLSGRNNVAPETRKKVFETLAYLERSESAINRIPAETDVKLARTNLPVVLLHPWWLLSIEFFKDILHGIQAAADEQGVSLRLADVYSCRMQDITQHIYFTNRGTGG